MIVNANAPYIKMVSEQFDRCHGTLLQYVEFLNGSVSPVSAYAQLIPSLEDLVHKYHIEPEVCSSNDLYFVNVIFTYRRSVVTFVGGQFSFLWTFEAIRPVRLTSA